MQGLPCKAGASVTITEEVYRVCVGHALMTEREEVMGLLLGEVSSPSDAPAGVPGDVSIWSCMTLSRSDKRPDRCEISPEQLVGATTRAERLTDAIQRKTCVVGWYHSHPHITVLPSHVDLRTQLQYQGMEKGFVGLIFAVFNANPRLGNMQHEVMAFRTQAGDNPVRVCLQVTVVPERSLLSEEECLRAVQLHKSGGWIGEDGLVDIAAQSHAEMVDRHTSTLAALADSAQAPGSFSLARMDAWSAQQQRLSGMIQRELVPLRQHLIDESRNNDVLSDLYEERMTIFRERSSMVPVERASQDDSDTDCSSDIPEEGPEHCVQYANVSGVVLDVEDFPSQADAHQVDHQLQSPTAFVGDSASTSSRNAANPAARHSPLPPRPKWPASALHQDPGAMRLPRLAARSSRNSDVTNSPSPARSRNGFENELDLPPAAASTGSGVSALASEGGSSGSDARPKPRQTLLTGGWAPAQGPGQNKKSAASQTPLPSLLATAGLPNDCSGGARAVAMASTAAAASAVGGADDAMDVEQEQDEFNVPEFLDGCGHIVFDGKEFIASPYPDTTRNRIHPDTLRSKAKVQRYQVSKFGEEEAHSLARRYLRGERHEDLMTDFLDTYAIHENDQTAQIRSRSRTPPRMT